MKTTILTTSLILALSAYASASPSKDNQELNLIESQNSSLIESLKSNGNGRNQHALSHIDTLVTQATIQTNKGRNMDIQSIAIKKFMKGYEKQFAAQSF